jgi:hypothetical protein
MHKRNKLGTEYTDVAIQGSDEFIEKKLLAHLKHARGENLTLEETRYAIANSESELVSRMQILNIERQALKKLRYAIAKAGLSYEDFASFLK